MHLEGLSTAANSPERPKPDSSLCGSLPFRACRLPWGAHTHPWIQTPGLEYTGDAVGAEAFGTASCSGATKHRLRSPTLSLRTLRVYFIKIATCLHDSSNSSSPLCRNFSHTPFFLIYVGPNYTQIINDCRSQSR